VSLATRVRILLLSVNLLIARITLFEITACNWFVWEASDGSGTELRTSYFVHGRNDFLSATEPDNISTPCAVMIAACVFVHFR